jgi:hypothetical protein
MSENGSERSISRNGFHRTIAIAITSSNVLLVFSWLSLKLQSLIYFPQDFIVLKLNLKLSKYTLALKF